MIMYDLDDGGLDTKLDKELKKFIIEKYGLEWTGQGYDNVDKERDIMFEKKVGE